MRLKEAYLSVRESLSAVTDEADTEAFLLLRHFTGRTRAEILTSEEETDEAPLFAAVRRRLDREPLQYILGEWSFFGLDLAVTPDALIPRQDTEILAERALELIRARGYRTLLDICTGTGCIAIALAGLSGIAAEASDISPACVRLARENAARNGVKLTVREADLFEGAGRYDLVTANPPYIPTGEIKGLQPELRFEPALALDGGEDGLKLYRRIAAAADEHINEGGALLLEVGYGETEAAAALFGGRKTSIIKDLNGINRVVEIEY